MVNLSNAFRSLASTSALVIGDFMVDTYTKGEVKRISPEASVPVLQVDEMISHPGGAGNVSLNLRSLGAKVYALGRVGDDPTGELLLNTLQKDAIDTKAFVTQKGYKTPIKNRLIGGSQQLLRVDQETNLLLTKELEEKIFSSLPAILDKISIIAVSDYNKGFVTPSLLQRVITMAKKKNIPVIVDPKGSDFSKYKGATIVKPNLLEAYIAAGITEERSLTDVAKILLQQTDAKYILVTRSHEGISLFDRQGNREDFPVRVKEVKDVTGAGDTVLAICSISLANGLDIQHAAMLANIAAGIAIEKVGCAQISLSQLARRLLEYDCNSKIFDESHLYILKEVVRPFSILSIDSKKGINTELFKAIKQLSTQDHDLILYVIDSNPHKGVLECLSSLLEVDFVILKEQTEIDLVEILSPEEIYVIEKGKLKRKSFLSRSRN